MNSQELQQRIDSLLIYQDVFESTLGQAFLAALSQHGRYLLNPTAQRFTAVFKAYGRWFHDLGMQPLTWCAYIEQRILLVANPLAYQIAQKQGDNAEISQGLLEAACQDLETLEWVAQYGPQALRLPEMPEIDAQRLGGTFSPSIFGEYESWNQAILHVCEHYRQHGTGVFAQYQALYWTKGRFVGITNPDPIHLTELVGYERQKSRLCRNTEALLNGYPALNVLLYGCRGAGKSALVKALVHEYGDLGLRLIELSKADLIHLPEAIQDVAQAPQKFVFFVDDLSFEEDEESYKALKVVLEGNLTARPQNVVVYATSNRRHLIREFFEDRPKPKDADEVHAWDTVQEKLSLSDRFGLSLTFQPADQELFLKIVFHLAQCRALSIESSELQFRALQWATQQNGRSGRTAHQFIQALEADLNQAEPEGKFV